MSLQDAAKCPALFAELSRKDMASLSGEKGGSKRDQKKEENYLLITSWKSACLAYEGTVVTALTKAV